MQKVAKNTVPCIENIYVIGWWDGLDWHPRHTDTQVCVLPVCEWK